MAALDVQDELLFGDPKKLPKGMTHADFNNNPGNIKSHKPNGELTDYAKFMLEQKIPFEKGTQATDGGYFFHFPDMETGYKSVEMFWPKVRTWRVYSGGDMSKMENGEYMSLDEALLSYSGGITVNPGKDNKNHNPDYAVGERYRNGSGYTIDMLFPGQGIDGTMNMLDVTNEQWTAIKNQQLRWEDHKYYKKLQDNGVVPKKNIPFNKGVNASENQDDNVDLADNVPDNNVVDGGGGDGKDNVVITQEGEEENIRTFDNEQEAKDARDTYEVGERVVVNGVEYIYKEDPNGIGELINEEGDTVKSIDLTLPDQYTTRQFESIVEAENDVENFNDGDTVVIGEKVYRYDADNEQLIVLDDEAQIVEKVPLTARTRRHSYKSIDVAKNRKESFNDGDIVIIEDTKDPNGYKSYRYDKENDQLIGLNPIVGETGNEPENVSLAEEEVEEEVQEQQEEEVVTEERADDPNTPARGPEPKESDRQRVEVSDMEVGKYYTILDPEKSEIVDDTGNLQDGVVELVAITENGEYEFQNTKTGKVFRVPADGLSGKLAQTNKDDVSLPQYNGVTIQPDTTFILDGKAYSREDLRRIGGGTVKDGVNKLTEGKSDEEKKKIFRELAKSQTEIGNIKGRNSQIFNIYGELPDAVDTDSGGDGMLDKDGDGIPDTIDIDAGEGSNQVTPGVETPEDKPEGETTNLQRAGEIGKNLLQGVGTLLDAVGGPGAIVSYIMGKKGMEAAMKEIEPQAMPELSPMFMQHLRQAKELAKRGFHPDQEREFRKELDTAYGIGLENAVRGSGGQRARFLAQSGILDAQRSSALLDFAAKDAELQAANQDKYEKVMLFKENFDLQRSEQQRAEDMARQREEKEAAAGFVGSAFSSLMNSYSNMNTSAIMNKMVQSGMQNLFNPNTIIGLRNQDAFKNNETYQNITDG
tara:strand:+ start:27 stop:2807 length:2781 start_codon:yes stop_codon:yes gene_type:complete